MAETEAAASTKAERAKDKRLQRTYGINLTIFNAMLDEQHGRCKICKRLFVELDMPICCDHFHFRINADRVTDGWQAHTVLDTGQVFCESAKTKAAAIAAVKHVALPHSVRGLLCWACNRGLGYTERFFMADAARIHSAAEYLANRKNPFA